MRVHVLPHVTVTLSQVAREGKCHRCLLPLVLSLSLSPLSLPLSAILLVRCNDVLMSDLLTPRGLFLPASAAAALREALCAALCAFVCPFPSLMFLSALPSKGLSPKCLGS